jgi:hypothetical protein
LEEFLAAGLRAGVPCVTVPVLADQPRVPRSRRIAGRRWRSAPNGNPPALPARIS